MKEATAQDKIQDLITQYEVGPKKATPSDTPVIGMLKPLLKKQYPIDPVKHLEAVIVDLSAILKIKYTQTVTKKTFKKAVITFTPDVLGGNVTPGIHGDIEALVAELRQKLSNMTQQVAAPAKNNDAELAEANRRAEALAAQLAEANRKAEAAAAALAAEKAKPQQPAINPQTEAALAEAKRQAELAAAEKAKSDAALAAEKEKSKADRNLRRTAQKEAKAKEKAVQEAQAQLKAKEAEATEAKATAAKTQAELQEYKAGEEQRLQQATVDGATQVIRRFAQVVSTNDVMLLAITQGFGGMQQFTNALITGNVEATHANGNGQLAQRTPAQLATAPAAVPNGNHPRAISEAEEGKYKKFLGEARFNIILRLLSLHDAAQSNNERLMVRYFICQLVLHMNDKSIKDTATEASALFHQKKFMLAKDYPEFHAFLRSLCEEPQNENELTGALLTKELCAFMIKRLSGKAESGVLLLPTDSDAVQLFTKYYKEVNTGKKTIPPSIENTYRETITGELVLPKLSSPIYARKENAAAVSSSSRLTEVNPNTLGL